MQPYANIGRDSGIKNYLIEDAYIVIEFDSGEEPFYSYNSMTPGAQHVEIMKQCAEAGTGLNEYINRNPDVRNGYAKKGCTLKDVL
jgi:hypothetical protein